MELIRGVTYQEEIWKPLNYNGIILGRYSVSDQGRIYDNKNQKLLPFHKQRGDYDYVSINDGTDSKNLSVHRAVMMSFEPILNFKDMQVNHKYDNKTYNWYPENLEWATPMDNTRHAIDNGLYNGVGMNNGKARYSDEEIHQVCKLIDEGLSVPEIADKLGHFEQNERNIFCANVRCIKKGQTRTHILKDYNFMKNHKRGKRYSLDFAHLVCNFLSDSNRDYTYKEIMNLLQIPNEERLTFKFYIEDLIKGKTAKDVTKLYNLKKPKDYYESDIDKYEYLMS